MHAANERTFLAWMRTSATLLRRAFDFRRPDVEHSPAVRRLLCL
ncbi:DUF202 domain-containing protein [Streptomyces sp. 7R007]